MYNCLNVLKRPQIVVANKIDMPDTEEKIKYLTDHISSPLIFISAHHKKEIDKLLYMTLEELKKAPIIIDQTPVYSKTYTLEEAEPDFILTKSDTGFDLLGNKLKLLFERTDFTKDEAVKRFARQLRSLGVDEALRKEGAKNGDTIRIFDYEFEFIE